EALNRWRDSCLFYFKFDLALIAALAAMVSFFRLEDDNLLLAAGEYKLFLQFLAALLLYALIFEAFITNTSNREDIEFILGNERKRTLMYRMFKWAYELQVFGHILLLSLPIGY